MNRVIRKEKKELIPARARAVVNLKASVVVVVLKLVDARAVVCQATAEMEIVVAEVEAVKKNNLNLNKGWDAQASHSLYYLRTGFYRVLPGVSD